MSERRVILERNLARIREQVDAAATQAGRAAADVQIVAVTKYVGPDVARDLFAAGIELFGESRPQLLWDKAEAMSDVDVKWHFVGHLQRNKVRRTLPHIYLLHSADSLRLLREIDTQATSLGRAVPVLLEINISGDEQKHGFSAQEMEAVLLQVADLKYISVRGVMAMAHRKGGEDVARRDFAAVRQLRDQLRINAPDSIALDELSLGMSRDFPQAILEGATLVRIGHAIFDGLPL